MQALSPELALVDPALARAARADLASYDQALPDVFELLERRRVAGLRREARLAPPLYAPVGPQQAPFPLPSAPPPAELEPHQLAGTLGSFFLKVTVAAMLAGAGALAAIKLTAENQGSFAVPRETHSHPTVRAPSIGVATSSRPAPAAAGAAGRSRSVKHRRSRAAGGPAVVPKPKHKHVVSRRGLRSTSKPARRALPVLAWARRPAATYYRVQIFRAGRAAAKQAFLFEVWTSRPRLAVPSSWTNGGRSQRLEPGTYRWYVYAVFGAKGVGTTSARTKSVALGTFAIARSR